MTKFIKLMLNSCLTVMEKPFQFICPYIALIVCNSNIKTKPQWDRC